MFFVEHFPQKENIVTKTCLTMMKEKIWIAILAHRLFRHFAGEDGYLFSAALAEPVGLKLGRWIEERYANASGNSSRSTHNRQSYKKFEEAVYRTLNNLDEQFS